MVFSDTSASKAGMIEECESILFDDNYGQISGDATLLATFTRRMNRALDKVVTKIQKADGRWQWDDNNQTDYPIATTNLVSGQQDYALSITHLRILRVEAKDSNGTFTRLLPIDQSDIQSATSQFLTTGGTPLFYDKFANSIFLYPIPNYASTNGLKVYFQRGPSYFATSDTTKEPGFVSLFHELIPKWASYEYAAPKGMALASGLRDEITLLEQELVSFYSLRDKDEKTQMRAKKIIYR